MLYLVYLLIISRICHVINLYDTLFCLLSGFGSFRLCDVTTIYYSLLLLLECRFFFERCCMGFLLENTTSLPSSSFSFVFLLSSSPHPNALILLCIAFFSLAFVMILVQPVDSDC
ncbi:hypothetical protein HGRIS_007488 [Hohenbuehelia grisea]|uniref:NADH dehydrogenase subunit 6 n=1 Tax=Hohenbuehelia grisea TaxID=104357 RepID=A0ABR3J562_9AGAR